MPGRDRGGPSTPPASKARAAVHATKTIDTALDVEAFRRDLIEGTNKMFGIKITSPDPER